MTVKSIGDRYLPVEVAQKIKWEEIQGVIVLALDKDGNAHLHVSDMAWADRMWLSAELETQNTAERVLELLRNE